MALGEETMTHPSRSLDEVIHQKNRLGILAVLAEADFVDFGYLKEVLDLTDGNLSRHSVGPRGARFGRDQEDLRRQEATHDRRSDPARTEGAE